jgi:hypothetical protein
VKLPPSGTPVRYRRCNACASCSLTPSIAGAYNEDYAAVDPECAEARPRNNAATVVALFGVGRSERRVLDYGGGKDALCAQLRTADFRSP